MTTNPLQLHVGDVVKFVGDHAELHHRVGAENGAAEREARVVGAPVDASPVPIGQHLGANARAAQAGQLFVFRVHRLFLILRIRTRRRCCNGRNVSVDVPIVRMSGDAVILVSVVVIASPSPLSRVGPVVVVAIAFHDAPLKLSQLAELNFGLCCSCSPK